MNSFRKNSSVPVKHPDKFFIGGEWVEPSSTSTIDVISPANEEKYLRVAEAQEADINRAVEAARHAFDHGPWPRLSPKERAGYMIALAEELEKRAADIAEVWPNEMGVIHSVAQAFSAGAGFMFRNYAAMAETFPFEVEHPTISGAQLALLVREPVGVVGAIIPWNGPMGLIGFKLAPALLAGCTMIIKSSPEAPSHGLIVAEAAQAVKFPPGVINVLTADRAASERLVRHPGVDKISFTGSSVAGMSIASILGARMGRYTMELGGKSAAIILDDYDIETAAATIADDARMMSGQVCASLTRIVIPRKRHNQMFEALSSAFRKITVGDPFDPATQMGPVASQRQRDRVEGFIARAQAEGAILGTGGGRPRNLNRGFFVEPTVFGNVDNRSNIGQEEVFGPVLSIVPVEDEADAVAIANDSNYGLCGAVFTNDIGQAYKISRQVRTGTMGHNKLRMDFSIAFGGFKQSGVGREGGVDGLMPYLEAKTILLDGKPPHLA
jgi:acyl-CoA reductase-like NAD-dependent aldehyde dehydrogenase